MLFHEEIVFHIGHNSFTMLVFEDWIQSGSFTCAQRALHTSTVDEQHLRWQNIIRFGRRKPREASERKQEIVKDILRESRSVQHAASSPSECHLLNAQSSGRENYLIIPISRPLRAPPRGGEVRPKSGKSSSGVGSSASWNILIRRWILWIPARNSNLILGQSGEGERRQ